MSGEVSLLMAFFAGLLTFLSPCMLPLIPAYISFVTGISIDELMGPRMGSNMRTRISLEILLFISGFSLIFILLGGSASYLGKILLSHLRLLRVVGGGLVILFGLYIAGAFKVGFLAYEKRISLRNKPANFFGSFVAGTVFALGWTPCAGPVLASILTYAGTQQNMRQGMILLAFYSLGMAVPFLICGLAINLFLRGFRRIKRYARVISVVTGGLLVFIGILMILGKFGYIRS